MEMEKRMWGIHTLDDRLFLDNDVIAIGWVGMGDLSKLPPDRESYKEQYTVIYPTEKKRAIPTKVGMLYRFCCEAQIGDYVVFPSKFNREINLGVIEGDYFFNAAASEYAQQRRVRWRKHYPRTAFSQGALYEVGSALTFFSIKNYYEEYLRAFDSGFQPKQAGMDEDETVARIAEDIIESTKDFILKELSKDLKGYALEDFVADLLNAMGYRTEKSARGGDRGIDIAAYKDELPPRILVQVKSQDGDIKEATIQSLKGAMREGDYGLFVSLSGYTKNAVKYLESNPIIRGINGAELAELVLQYYDRLSDKYKRMIPLKKVYIPVTSEE